MTARTDKLLTRELAKDFEFRLDQQKRNYPATIGFVKPGSTVLAWLGRQAGGVGISSCGWFWVNGKKREAISFNHQPPRFNVGDTVRIEWRPSKSHAEVPTGKLTFRVNGERAFVLAEEEYKEPFDGWIVAVSGWWTLLKMSSYDPALFAEERVLGRSPSKLESPGKTSPAKSTRSQFISTLRTTLQTLVLIAEEANEKVVAAAAAAQSAPTSKKKSARAATTAAEVEGLAADQAVIHHLMSLNASELDTALRSVGSSGGPLKGPDGLTEGIREVRTVVRLFVRTIANVNHRGGDFEWMQTMLAIFLRLHQETFIRETAALYPGLEALFASQRKQTVLHKALMRLRYGKQQPIFEQWREAVKEFKRERLAEEAARAQAAAAFAAELAAAQPLIDSILDEMLEDADRVNDSRILDEMLEDADRAVNDPEASYVPKSDSDAPVSQAGVKRKDRRLAALSWASNASRMRVHAGDQDAEAEGVGLKELDSMLMSLIDQAQEVDAEWVEKERQEADRMLSLAQEVSAEESLGPSTSDQKEDDSLLTTMEDVNSLLSQLDQNEMAAAPDAEAAAAPYAEAAAAAVKTAGRLGSQKSMAGMAAALRIGSGIKSYTADVVEAVSARRDLALAAEEEMAVASTATSAHPEVHPEVVAADPGTPLSFALPFSFFSAFLTPSFPTTTGEEATGEKAISLSMKAAEMFGLMDTDGSGAISKEEIATHMNERGYSDEEIASAMSVLDVDGDGKVTLEEFTKGLESAEALRA